MNVDVCVGTKVQIFVHYPIIFPENTPNKVNQKTIMAKKDPLKFQQTVRRRSCVSANLKSQQRCIFPWVGEKKIETILWSDLITWTFCEFCFHRKKSLRVQIHAPKIFHTAWFNVLLRFQIQVMYLYFYLCSAGSASHHFGK